MTYYLLSAAILAATTVLSFWTAMNWPERRADLTIGLLGGSAVALWSVVNTAHPGPAIGSLPVTVADGAALPVLLASSLLVGRTILLRNHPYVPPAARRAHGPAPTVPTPDPAAAPH